MALRLLVAELSNLKLAWTSVKHIAVTVGISHGNQRDSKEKLETDLVSNIDSSSSAAQKQDGVT